MTKHQPPFPKTLTAKARFESFADVNAGSHQARLPPTADIYWRGADVREAPLPTEVQRNKTTPKTRACNPNALNRIERLFVAGGGVNADSQCKNAESNRAKVWSIKDVADKTPVDALAQPLQRRQGQCVSKIA
jgi:hypothetical protein